MMRRYLLITALVLCSSILGFEFGKLPTTESANRYTRTQIQRGSYLVNAIGGCNDCHTPKEMTPHGPALDMKMFLAGAPSDEKVPPIPKGLGKKGHWVLLGTMDGTTFAGPWGVSFAANLTPDTATGIGGWTERMFIKAMRKGKFWGTGRPLLPPMPWEEIGRMSTNDLRDIFAYLMSIRPVRNEVPNPVPPTHPHR